MPTDCKTLMWILILFSSSTGVSHSAEFRLDNHSIVIEGEIRSGDFDRFDSVVKASGPKYDSLILGSLGARSRQDLLAITVGVQAQQEYIVNPGGGSRYKFTIRPATNVAILSDWSGHPRLLQARKRRKV